MQGQLMLWRPHRNYLQTTLNCYEINVSFNIVVALLFVSIMMLNQHTVGPSTLLIRQNFMPPAGSFALLKVVAKPEC